MCGAFLGMAVCVSCSHTQVSLATAVEQSYLSADKPTGGQPAYSCCNFSSDTCMFAWCTTSFDVMTTSKLGDRNPMQDLTITNFRSIEKPTVPLL
jgi:hypothetical protein